jgi:hypothetical protein
MPLKFCELLPITRSEVLMKIQWMMVALLLSACVTTPKVAPIGKDTYLVTASNDACGNCTPPEIRAANEASSYCAAQSKTATVEKTDVQTFDMGYGHRVLTTFRCEAR